MKKIIQIIKKNIVGFILGGIIFGTTGIMAASQLASSSVYYNNTNSGGSSNTVSGALDELYNMAATHCPDGYTCKEILPICKRATTLHTETCGQTSNYCASDGYAKGDTITYGNLGTSGTLATGDAFDCDVNGDGTYDAATERFYYVSDMTNGVTTDSNIAVLIYYNNVSAGEPNNMAASAYDLSGSNNNGPVTAIAQLPTTCQWSNVSLTSTTRQITNQEGKVTTSLGALPSISCEGYAARLLTTQELESGCGFTVVSYTKGELSSKCKYLMENTKYSSSSLKLGVWLETPNYPLYTYRVWSVNSNYRYVYDERPDYSDRYGVRPAIEVLKSDISY